MGESPGVAFGDWRDGISPSKSARNSPPFRRRFWQALISKSFLDRNPPEGVENSPLRRSLRLASAPFLGCLYREVCESPLGLQISLETCLPPISTHGLLFARPQ